MLFFELRKSGFMQPIYDLSENDPEFIKEITVIFLKNIRIDMLALKFSIENCDNDATRKAAHKIRSSAKLFEMKQVEENLKFIEQYKKEDWGEIVEVYASIKSEIDQYCTVLEKEFRLI